MAYCVCFDFSVEITNAQRLWKFKTPNDVEWCVQESWVVSSQPFPRASLSSSTSEPQRFAHEIFVMQGEISKYYAKIIITSTEGYHPSKQILRTLDLPRKLSAEIPFTEYKSLFSPSTTSTRPVVLRCTIHLFPLFHINSPDCVFLSHDSNQVPTLHCDDGINHGLCEDMMKLLHEGFHSDVVVKSGSLVRKAHKNILVTRSPVFAMMIEGFAEQDQVQTLQLLDMEEDVLDEMLAFIYSGVADLKDDSLARRLHTIADKYEIADLKEFCSSYLHEMASIDDNPV